MFIRSVIIIVAVLKSFSVGAPVAMPYDQAAFHTLLSAQHAIVNTVKDRLHVRDTSRHGCRSVNNIGEG